MKEVNKKIIVLSLVFMLAFSPVLATKAEAQWVDWANLIPNTITGVGTFGSFMKIFLDAVAYQMINLVIQKMTASTVNWINSGFKGSPAFMTNPEAYFGNMTDNVVGNFVFGPNSKLNFLCGPIQAKIRIALTKNYLGDNDLWRCSLTQVGRNMEDFMNDFENGGWDSFFEISQRSTMNPIGAYLQAENEMYTQIANKQILKNQELDWGKGFLSFKTCAKWSDPNSAAAKADNYYGDELGNFRDSNTDISQYRVPECEREEISTPGNVIENKLNSVLKIGDNRVGVANAINQMLSALLNQVASQIVGGIGKGLRGMSRPSSTGGPSLADQLLEEERKADTSAYFVSSAERANAALNAEQPNPNLCRENPNHPDCNAPGQEYCDAQCMICRNNPNAPECSTTTP